LRESESLPSSSMCGRGSGLLVLFLAVPCAGVVAQGQAPLPQPGSRVRIAFLCEPPHHPPVGAVRSECRSEGRLVLLSRDPIALAVAGSTTNYSLNALTRLEVSRGRKSHSLAGAGVGFLVGAGATFALLHSGGSTSLCDRSANQDALNSGECIGLTALGGLAGAGVGAVVGALLRAERRQDIPVERLRVGAAPQPGSKFGLAFAVSF